MIRIREDIVVEDPQVRIRKYCEEDSYNGYDNSHNINNEISKGDIEAAKILRANIDRFHRAESEGILKSEGIRKYLALIPDLDILTITDEEWDKYIVLMGKLIAEFVHIDNINLAKATKILHLKRPKLFPILDSKVFKFLTGKEIPNIREKREEAFIQVMGKVRDILIGQKLQFNELVKQTADLPIPLTPVRMFDILCWTTQKDIEKNRNTPQKKGR